MATKKTEVKVDKQSVLNIFNAAILQQKSAGARIRDIFAEVLADGKITVEVMNQLASEQFTKSKLKPLRFGQAVCTEKLKSKIQNQKSRHVFGRDFFFKNLGGKQRKKVANFRVISVKTR